MLNTIYKKCDTTKFLGEESDDEDFTWENYCNEETVRGKNGVYNNGKDEGYESGCEDRNEAAKERTTNAVKAGMNGMGVDKLGQIILTTTVSNNDKNLKESIGKQQEKANWTGDLDGEDIQESKNGVNKHREIERGLVGGDKGIRRMRKARRKVRPDEGSIQHAEGFIAATVRAVLKSFDENIVMDQWNRRRTKNDKQGYGCCKEKILKKQGRAVLTPSKGTNKEVKGHSHGLWHGDGGTTVDRKYGYKEGQVKYVVLLIEKLRNKNEESDTFVWRPPWVSLQGIVLLRS